VPSILKTWSDSESSSDVKYRTQRISTMAVISQPALMASSAGALTANIPWFTPMTANTTAIAPNVDIWKRCIAIESLARV
jgi:hypothetical protein